MKNTLTQLFADIFKQLDLDPNLGQITVSNRPDLADFQCNGAFTAAKALKQNPRALAEEVVKLASEKFDQAEFTVAGPGFINVKVSQNFLIESLSKLLNDPRIGDEATATPQKIFFDYGGPNVAKPMHVGHLRSAVIGNALVRIFRFRGHDVTGDIHMGDWGTQMGLLIHGISCEQPDLPYFDPDFSGPYPKESPITLKELEALYPKMSAASKEDESIAEAARKATFELQQGRAGYIALWQHFMEISLAEMKKDFGFLGIDFEQWFGESRYQERAENLIKRLEQEKQARRNDGALIIDVEEETDKSPMPPLLLQKSDGGLIYASTDMATMEERVKDFGATYIFYVVDGRQSLHFEQVIRASKKTGIVTDTTCEHLGFGTVNGSDGKPFKTRAGGVMKLSDLYTLLQDEAAKILNEEGVFDKYDEEETASIAKAVAISALKFGDLQHDRTQDYVFDVKKFSSFEGKTGPYLLYAAVRMKSLLAQAEERGIKLTQDLNALPEEAKALALLIMQFSDKVRLSARKRLPSILTEYAYSLAKEFSRFYANCHMLSEKDAARQASLLSFTGLTLTTITQTLDLLGITVPERM